MISKICSGHSFYGSIRYVCQEAKKNAILASEGVRAFNPKLMIEDFKRQHAYRPEKTQACFHGILSFYPGEKPTDAVIKEISLKYLKGLGIINTQFAVVKHADRAHQHVHLIANLVNNNGQSIPDKWIGLRGKKMAQQLTVAYKLQQSADKKLNKTSFNSHRTPEKHQYRIYAAVTRYLRKSDSFEELESRLGKLGIQMEFKYKGQTQERQGVSFRLGEYCFKGSKIDRKFSYGNLTKTLAANQQRKVQQTSWGKHQPMVTRNQKAVHNRFPNPRETDQHKSDLLEILLRAEQMHESDPLNILKQQEQMMKKKPKRKIVR